MNKVKFFRLLIRLFISLFISFFIYLPLAFAVNGSILSPTQEELIKKYVKEKNLSQVEFPAKGPIDPSAPEGLHRYGTNEPEFIKVIQENFEKRCDTFTPKLKYIARKGPPLMAGEILGELQSVGVEGFSLSEKNNLDLRSYSGAKDCDPQKSKPPSSPTPPTPGGQGVDPWGYGGEGQEGGDQGNIWGF